MKKFLTLFLIFPLSCVARSECATGFGSSVDDIKIEISRNVAPADSETQLDKADIYAPAWITGYSIVEMSLTAHNASLWLGLSYVIEDGIAHAVIVRKRAFLNQLIVSIIYNQDGCLKRVQKLIVE